MAKVKGWKSPGITVEDAGSLKAFGFDTVPEIRLGMVDPAVSEKQRKFMAGCAHSPAHMKGKCPDMPKKKMREFSKKPKGGY